MSVATGIGTARKVTLEVFNSIRAMHAIAGVDLYLAWLLRAEPSDPARSRLLYERHLRPA